MKREVGEMAKPWILTFLGLLTIASVALFASDSVLASQPNSAGPQDHTWSVSYSSTAAGSHPDVAATLTLGTLSSPGYADTTFFRDATTTFSGLEPAGSRSLAAPNLGDLVGTIAFQIQTNVNPALLASNNIDPAGGGQAGGCQNGTGLLVATVGASSTPIFAASTNAADPSPVSSKIDPATVNNPVPQGTANLMFDQEADPANGGRPNGVSHIPDWYKPVLTGLGIPTSQIIDRSMAIASVLTNQMSVSFLTVDTGVPSPAPGVYVAVTVLGDPRGSFNAAGQTIVTCPPFSSTVTTFGVTQAALAANTGTGADWTACADYFGNALSTYIPAPSCTAYGGATGGVNNLTVTAVAGTYPYKIAVSTTPDLDNDAGASALSTPDNCPVDANGPLPGADANANGIGNACKGGGATWTNNSASAIANASLTCAPGFQTSPPFAACQDSDQDGALNSVDNCPLVANADLNSWLKSGATILDNQADNDRDGIGNACDPEPNIPGDGKGYAPVNVGGLGVPPWAAGTYHDYKDVCDQGFAVGGAVSPQTCIATSGTDQGWLDSSNDGTPDFYNPGAGQPCVQDHAGDANGDGYSDSDSASPTTSPSCTGAFPATGMGIDPLGGAVTATGCFTNPKLARIDINHDGNINGLDLGILARNFTKVWYFNSDPVAESNAILDHLVQALDLGVLATYYSKNVAATCAAQAFYSTQKNTTYAIAWDRQAAGAHTIEITCTTGPQPIATVTTTVMGVSGKYSLPISVANSTGCTFKFDGTTLGVTTKF